MTKWIIGAVVGGILAGYFFVPEALAAHCGTFITVGLCLILFLVGVDMGRQGNVWRDIRAAGFKVLLIPVAVAVGTIGFAAVSSLFLPLTAQEAMAASAGFGWYSLAPMLLSSYSATLSAVAFLSNVMGRWVPSFSFPSLPSAWASLNVSPCPAPRRWTPFCPLWWVPLTSVSPSTPLSPASFSPLPYQCLSL